MPRKQHKYHYIYKTTCTVTGNYYIGMHSTSNLEDGYMGSGKRLGYSIRKHGLENHEREILEFLPNRASLKQREKEIVNEQLLSDPTCMNLTLGGGGWPGKGFKIGGDNCKNVNLFWKTEDGKNLKHLLTKNRWSNEDYREKMVNLAKTRKPFLGKLHTEDSKKRIGVSNSIKQIGEKNSQYGTCWITNGTENKKIKKTDDLPEGWSYGRK